MSDLVVPLFPLPNVVLFPGAVLPLHIFEERYKRMTSELLRGGDRRLAMALLRAGWEKDYYGRPAIEPVVCVGQILSHERLEDGRYNFLLQGERRARVVGEEGRDGYRLARIEPLAETNDDEAGLTPLREALLQLFTRGGYATLPAGEQVRRMLAADVPTAVVADVLAFNVLGEQPVALRQSLLAETDVMLRVARTIEALAALSPAWQNLPDDARMN
jgi:Lon protease-like protein